VVRKREEEFRIQSSEFRIQNSEEKRREEKRRGSFGSNYG